MADSHSGGSRSTTHRLLVILLGMRAPGRLRLRTTYGILMVTEPQIVKKRNLRNYLVSIPVVFSWWMRQGFGVFYQCYFLDRRLESTSPRRGESAPITANAVTFASIWPSAPRAPPPAALCSLRHRLHNNCFHRLLFAARGRPIIVEWERRKAFGGPLSFGDSS
ncbi:hypothetical protein EVAR_99809_1 [Eumeta japonica]|uniref:Uncharacterized protein n=1 Tax=Eumeta variegata TaxID=151549 RepID=A0A4C1ZGE7_EUMVA|nr:hypothetical protein EVAR_99809_1 [Eumeta japonica]